MLRKITLALICSICIAAWGQLNQHQVDAFRADVDAYGAAVKKVISSDRCQEGINDFTALISRCEKDANYSQKRLASYYRGRGHGYLRLKQYSSAIADHLKCIDLLQKSDHEGLADLSDAWYQLSLDYYYSNKQTDALRAADKCVETAIKYYGPLHSTTLGAYSLRSNYEGFFNMSDKALDDRIACFEIIQKNIERNFTYLTANERAAYWEKNLPETTVMFAFAHKMGVKEGKFTDALYNQQLLAKGLLLTAESSLQRTIDSIPKLAETYGKIRALRKKVIDGNGDINSTSESILEADRLEREITTTANGIGQFMNFLSTHADDVKGKLSTKDVAIEFVDYRVGKDSTMYAALIMSPRWQHVRLLSLAEKTEIEQSKDNLAPLIWEPIIRLLDSEISNIYFAPSGMLYQIPIESHKLTNGQLICEKYNLYRLSSTRWLANNRQKALGKDAVLYGDLQYDTSIAELTADMSRYPTGITRSGNLLKLRGASNAMGLQPLPATKKEVESILQIFIKSKPSPIKTESYMGIKGTETSFKALSSSNKRIIHIATHGFFNDEKATSDNALSESGLCFAGADNKLLGEDIPLSVNDGILTAEEVSQMDLSGLDMLTLSACETGLGNITSDGVFGLQRGFKKAGANSILMSLWKVDDEATCKLMTEFYSNWIGKNMTKHDALEAAKTSVRTDKDHSQWQDPKYWAAFILLDALD